MPIDKSCKKFIVVEKNVLATRAEIRYHSLANLPTCNVPCTQLVLILRGINILSSTVLKYNMIIFLFNIMVHYPLGYL
jgi:hypothetical protein